MLSFEAARAKVIEVVAAHAGAPPSEIIDIAQDAARALGRVLAEDVLADRNYPPFDRSTRDGYAVQSADFPADALQPGSKLRLIGESRAGVPFAGSVGPGECVRILTGAAVPDGANAVVMQEYARVEGDSVAFERAATSGQNIVPAAAEARSAETLVARGTRLGYAELALVAQVGAVRLPVARRPRVAILATGEEIVEVNKTPGPCEIRNSNSVSLAAQVALAGGEPVVLSNAPDELGELRAQIQRGLDSDILVLSGGVSVGTYDLVEPVLRELGAEFFFDSVAIRPGKPAVFAWCRPKNPGKPVFGLPGNPVSTMVTFELLVVPAIEILTGAKPRPLPLFKARLAHPVNEKPPLAHFLPARLTWPAHEVPGPEVEVISWQGSGDVRALVRGNCFLVVHGEKQKLDAGEWVDVLPRRGMF